jgi:hypothetical protein
VLRTGFRSFANVDLENVVLEDAPEIVIESR